MHGTSTNAPLIPLPLDPILVIAKVATSGGIMNATVNIGRTIAREHRRLGVTQEVLAAHFGISRAVATKQ